MRMMLRRDGRGVMMRVPHSQACKNQKRRHHKSAKPCRSIADSFRSANIPHETSEHECSPDCRTMPASDKIWCESFKVADEEQRIQAHVEHGRSECLPRFLKAPEIS